MPGDERWIRSSFNTCHEDVNVANYDNEMSGRCGLLALKDPYIYASQDDIHLCGRSGHHIGCIGNSIGVFRPSRPEPLWQPTRLTSPYCVLSANGVQDDFYTSCLSWGRENVALALRDEVLLFQPPRHFVRPGVLNVRERGRGSISRVTSVAVSQFSDSSCFIGKLDGSAGMFASHDGQLVSTCAFSMPSSPFENTPLVGETAMAAVTSVRCFATSGSHPWMVAAGTAAQGVFILDSRCTKPAAHMAGRDLLLSHSGRISKEPLSPDDCVSLISSADGICGVSWNASGSLVATGGSGGVVNIWSLFHTRAPVQQIRLPNTHTTIKAIAFHPTNSYELAVGGGTNDGVLRLYDVSSLIPHLAWCVFTGSQITQALYSPDGAFLASAQGSQHTSAAVTPNGAAADDGDGAHFSTSLMYRPTGTTSDLHWGTTDQSESVVNGFERGMTGNNRTEEASQEPVWTNGDAGTSGLSDMSSIGEVPPFSLVMWRKGTRHRGSSPEGFVSDQNGCCFQKSRHRSLPLVPICVMSGHRSRPLQLTAPSLHTANQGCIASVAGGIDSTIRFWKCFCLRNEAVNWEQRIHTSMRTAVTDEDMEDMTSVPLR